MSYILNIDTATEVCSVCIVKNDLIISICESEEKYEHASLLTNYISQVLKEANIDFKDLNAVAISAGPGSYTGLRIGTSVAKGICYGHDLPLISIDTLKSLAYGILSKLEDSTSNILVTPMIDARRMEVYSAVYDKNLECVKSSSPVVLENDSYIEILNTHEVYFGGNGSEKFKEVIKHPNAKFIDIKNSSEYMISLALTKFNDNNFENIIYYEPFYLKGVNISKSDKNYF